MSEDMLNDEVLPASLQDGEPLISQDLIDKYHVAKEDQSAEPELEAIDEVAVEAEVEDTVFIEEPAIEEAPVINNVIGSPKADKEEKPKNPSIKAVSDGVIGSSSANKKDKVKKATTEEVEKVAVFSTRNVTWNGVGKVYRGYNIVTKDEADQWLKRDHIRLATPEEVAKEFGK